MEKQTIDETNKRASRNSRYMIIGFVIGGLILLFCVSKCNETFDADTPGKNKSVYYGKPILESRGDTTYNSTDSTKH